MIVQQLINPNSIVVVGGSKDVHKPGGKVLKNLIGGNFKGDLYVSNPKEDEVQGVKSYRDLNDLPDVDMAIIAVAAKYALPAVTLLTEKKNTKAFIIISAGFSEESHEGAILEQQIVDKINAVNGTLIGPNCTGVLTMHHRGIFSEPLPELQQDGCDFITGSGATACFILEAGISKGLRFSSIFAVGNSAQTGVEEVLEYMDESFDPKSSSRVKILYIENIDKPAKLLKHAKSLIAKGCRIAAVKAGSSDAGSRAASSHTGALASPDVAVDALFQKAGIVRCYGREDLISVASVFMYPQLQGENIAIITHAGGPAVMLTDALSNGGLKVPHIEGSKAEALKEKLYLGSSVANPIDFLATGTAEHLGQIIDAVDKDFEDIDGMAVIFGTPGLVPIFEAYEVLQEKMKTAKKPIYPILPSGITAKEETEMFMNYGRVIFPDEVTFGNALSKIYKTEHQRIESEFNDIDIDKAYIRAIIDSNESGYLLPRAVRSLLDGAGIPRAKEATVHTPDAAKEKAADITYPMVMKVVGPVHKSDVGGVVLNVKDDKQMLTEFERMMKIPDTTAILMQPMLSGTELFVGAKYEDKFGHMILCGLGGIFIEVLKDVQQALCPVSKEEAMAMFKKLRSYKILEGVRGQEPIDQEVLADIIVRLSALLEAAPEIKEMDLNPLLATGNKIIAVDARIRIEK